MNAVIDARYSSSSQREETVEVQLRECTKFAEENGYAILSCYTKSTPHRGAFFGAADRDDAIIVRRRPAVAGGAECAPH